MSLSPSTQPRDRRAHRRTVLRWIKRAALGAALGAIAVLVVRAWLPKPVSVEIGVARRADLTVEVAEDGQTRVRDRFVVSAPVSGTLRRIELDPGDLVDEGTPVARIEAPAPPLLDERSRREAAAGLEAALAAQRRAAAAVAGAAAAAETASREAARAKHLEERAAIAPAERERAELAAELARRDLAAAEAQQAAAAAEVDAARSRLAGAGSAGSAGGSRGAGGSAVTVVAAPTRGRVLRVLHQSAGPVAAGTPLLELGDVGAIEVVVDVLSADAARIRPGMPCAIDAWGGEGSLAGEVRRVEPAAFTRVSALGIEEQRVNVIVGIRTAPPGLGDGFRVEARIVTWRGRDVLAIPASAVFRDHGRWAVYTVEGERARLRPIEIGHRGRLEVEVTAGLAETAQIVLHPSDRLRDGAALAREP